MRIREKIYPYPVIKEEDADFQDYEKASFDFDIDINDNNDLVIKVDTKNIPDKLIPGKTNDKIQYGYQIESIMNKNRKFFLSNDPEYLVQLDGANYTGKVEINAYIIAKEALSINFNSNEDGIDSFYNGMVNFPKGGIIAVALPTKAIQIESDGSTPENPIRIVKDETVDGIRYVINNSQIRICLNEVNHNIYSTYGKDKNMMEFIFNAIVVPAVSKAIELLADGEVSEDSDWGNQFREKLLNSNISLEEINNGSETLEEATQAVLNNPIDKMFTRLKDYGENE